MYNAKIEKIDGNCLVFSFLFLFLFLNFKSDWGSLLSIFFVYLWITHNFELKRNKKWVIFTFFVILFHSFCGKLLLFSKICIIVCFLDSYFLKNASFKRYEFLQKLPTFMQQKVLKGYLFFFQYLFYKKALKSMGIYTRISRFYPARDLLFAPYERYIVLLKKKNTSFSFTFDRFLFLLLHIILFGIYFC